MKTKKEYREAGRHFMLGVFDAISYIIVLGFIAIAVMNTFNLLTDDSDKSGWERSGLIIHKDHKTGKEYISNGKGGVIPR